MISVIIPVYNVENFLKAAVDSVLVQSYKDLEIILVDDGSKDSSGKICDEYLEKDSRIKVIHKENGGLSSARNAGLDVAKGEYIAFLDSDDKFLNDNSLQNMFDVMSENESADICITGYKYIDEEGKELKRKKHLIDDYSDYDKTKSGEVLFKNITQDDFWNLYFDKNRIEYIVVWTKLYKKEIWETLRYPEGKINEDNFVLPDVINQCNKIAMCDIATVAYRVRGNSIIHDEKTSNSVDKSEAILKLCKYFIENQKYHFAKRAFKEGSVALLRSYVFYKKKDKSRLKEVNEIYKKYKKVVKSGKIESDGISDKIQMITFGMGIGIYRFVRNIVSSYKI